MARLPYVCRVSAVLFVDVCSPYRHDPFRLMKYTNLVIRWNIYHQIL